MEKGKGIENELIEGRNAVMEALRAGRAIDKLYINKGEVDKTLGHIASTGTRGSLWWSVTGGSWTS